MKKLSILMFAALLLTACSNNDKQQGSVNQETEETDASAGEQGVAEQGTDDPMEFAKQDSGYGVFYNGANEERIIYRYENEDTDENGLNTIEFDDYTMTFALALVEDINGEHSITIYGEQENKGKVDLMNPVDTTFVTDKQEKTTFSTGDVGRVEAGLKNKVHFGTYLDFEDPESFNMKMFRPITSEKNDEWGYGDEGDLESIELEFKKAK